MTRRVITITDAVEAMPVRVLIDSFLESKSTAPRHTFRAYERALNDFLAFTSHALELRQVAVLWHDINADAIYLWHCAISAEYSKNTAHQRISILKSFTKWVAKQHKCADKCKNIKAPAQTQLDFVGLTEGQVNALRTALFLGSEFKPVERFTVELLLGTGMRCAEARNLTLGQLRQDWKLWKAVKGKGGKTRDLPIPQELRREMVRYFSWRNKYPHKPEHPVLISLRGYKQRNPETLKASERTIYAWVQKVLMAAGAPKSIAHPHTLRHTYAYRMLDHIGAKENNPMRAIQVVQKLLGHSNVKDTLRYVGKDIEYIIGLVEDA